MQPKAQETNEMPYATDEHLKGYLDTNQMHREQMCLAVMAIDRRFTDVRPRHPRGGPDGARDIDAVLNGVLRAFGAVGFVNQATDSDAHKQSAAKKFRDDLAEALKQEPRPEAFIFFTNVNLTVGEKDALVQEAKAKGLAHAEVFDRERLRVALDSADGLSIRFQYLGIHLSEAEQAAFFARWGDDIQSLISDGFGAVQKSLNRIHFLQEAALPLHQLVAVLELDREYSGAEIGHFRAFAFVQLKAPVNRLLTFMFGATDNRARLKATNEEELTGEEAGIATGMCGGQWDMRIPEDLAKELRGESEIRGAEQGEEAQDDDEPTYEPSYSFTSVGDEAVETIRILYQWGSFIRFLPVPQLQDLDDSKFLLFINQSLAERVKAIHIYANAYKLTEIRADEFRIDRSAFEPSVPLFFSPQELADPWVRLRPKVASAFPIRFSEQTPKRFYHATEVPDKT